jgi:hypothetical protein
MPNPSREDYDALIQRIEKLLQENPQFDKQQVSKRYSVVNGVAAAGNMRCDGE